MKRFSLLAVCKAQEVCQGQPVDKRAETLKK